jgi:predicted ester cyclase
MSNLLTNENSLEILRPFYNLFCADKRDWEKGFGVLDENWKSYYTNEKYRTKAETRPYIAELFEIVPDINVEILDFFVSGDQVAVRSELSGTPKTDFMVPHNGRKFSIMTIDIHKISNGKIVELRHLEDWGTAIRQLSGQE